MGSACAHQEQTAGNSRCREASIPCVKEPNEVAASIGLIITRIVTNAYKALAAIRTAPRIPQPQALEMARLLGPVAVHELGSRVPGRAVVDELDLSRLEFQLDAQ